MDKKRIQSLLADLAERRERNRHALKTLATVDVDRADDLGLLLSAWIAMEDQGAALEREQAALNEIEDMLQARLDEIVDAEETAEADGRRQEKARERAGLRKKLATVTNPLEKARLLSRLAELDREGVSVHA